MAKTCANCIYKDKKWSDNPCHTCDNDENWTGIDEKIGTERIRPMTLEQNIKAILECNFAGYKDEIIEAATKRIIEQIERQNPVEDIKDNKQCGNCKYCVRSGSIFDVEIGYCTKKLVRVSLGSCCVEYEEGGTNEEVDTKQT